MPVGSSKDLESIDKKARVICAFDLDNFYVACERLRDPSLNGLPVGIQQKVCALYHALRSIHIILKLFGGKLIEHPCYLLLRSQGVSLLRGWDITLFIMLMIRNSRGISKLQSVREAKKTCPDLVIVK